MLGRKPKSQNVVPLREGDGGVLDPVEREKAVELAISQLMPSAFKSDKILQAEFKRVARILANPTVDRLKPKFVDTIEEYCVARIRLARLRAKFPKIEDETYEAETRNGLQKKTDPRVPQINEAWRHWYTLNQALGLNPADDRVFIPGQGDMFDAAESYFTGGG